MIREDLKITIKVKMASLQFKYPTSVPQTQIIDNTHYSHEIERHTHEKEHTELQHLKKIVHRRQKIIVHSLITRTQS